LAPGNIQCEAAAFRDFSNLPIIGESQRARQRRLHVIFEKLPIPTLPEHELHVDTLPACTTAALTQPFAASMGRWKRRAALAADLASIVSQAARSARATVRL